MPDNEIAKVENALPRMLPAEELPSPGTNAYLVYLGRLDSDESKRTMRDCLDRIAAMAVGQEDPPPAPWSGQAFTWHLLRHQHTAALRARMHERVTNRAGRAATPWSPSHINKHLVALRSVLKQAWKLGDMTTDDYMRAVAIDSAKGHREPVGRSIRAEEFAAMLAVCKEDPKPAGARDAAIIAVLHSTGLRRSEVAKAQRADYDAGVGSLRVIGKGNKQRTVYFHADATPYVTAWLRISGQIRGPLFCPVTRHGDLVDRPMTPRAIAALVDKRRLQAGLARLAPHDFRRTFAGDLLDAGADLVQVKGLLGHSSADVTARYDRRPERQKQAVVNRLTLPEPKRLHEDPSESLRDEDPERSET